MGSESQRGSAPPSEAHGLDLVEGFDDFGAAQVLDGCGKGAAIDGDKPYLIDDSNHAPPSALCSTQQPQRRPDAHNVPDG